jgi:glutamyl-tRNA reductase
VEAIVAEEVDRFTDWWDSLSIVPTIKRLRRQAEALRRREVAKALRRLERLSAEEQATVEALSRSLMTKLLHRPITVLKAQRHPQHLQALEELFGLDGEDG